MRRILQSYLKCDREVRKNLPEVSGVAKGQVTGSLKEESLGFDDQ